MHLEHFCVNATLINTPFQQHKLNLLWTVLWFNYCIVKFVIGIIHSPEESLFTYNDEESWITFYQPYFQPVFDPTFSSPELEEQANTICGSDPFCRFDIAATNRTEIGITTLLGNLEFEMISNISQPGIILVMWSNALWGDWMLS